MYYAPYFILGQVNLGYASTLTSPSMISLEATYRKGLLFPEHMDTGDFSAE